MCTDYKCLSIIYIKVIDSIFNFFADTIYGPKYGWIYSYVKKYNKLPMHLFKGNETLYYSGQIFYWEHFGLIEQPAYCKNTCEKLQLYMSHDIIPAITLITTYETSSTPLSYKTIEDIIRNYFLTP